MSISKKQLKSSSSSPLLLANGKAMKIILGILVAIVLIVFLALFFTRGLPDAAREQLSAIKSGDTAVAYSMTSKAFQQESSMDDFKKFIDKYPVLHDYKDITFTERKIENGLGYLNGTIEGTDGSKMQIEYQLVKENDKWKIQAIRISDVGLSSSAEDTQSPFQAANDRSGIVLHDVLINDLADEEGYVSDTKSTLSKSAPKIFATVQVVAPNGKGKVETILVQSNGERIGPTMGEITKKGNIMKAFSFTRTTEKWPPGKYSIIVNLSSGESKVVNFQVK